MKSVKVYTITPCPYCERAKNLLSSKNIPFEEVNLDGKDDELQALKDKTGLRTVPQIFIGEELIGGFSELASLDDSGDLDKKLSS